MVHHHGGHQRHRGLEGQVSRQVSPSKTSLPSRRTTALVEHPPFTQLPAGLIAPLSVRAATQSSAQLLPLPPTSTRFGRQPWPLSSVHTATQSSTQLLPLPLCPQPPRISTDSDRPSIADALQQVFPTFAASVTRTKSRRSRSAAPPVPSGPTAGQQQQNGQQSSQQQKEHISTSMTYSFYIYHLL